MEKRRGIFSYWSTIQLVFIALMVAADVGQGFVIKPLLGAVGIDEFIRLDLIIPTAFIIVTRLLVDKFGTIVLYEGMWGIIATLIMPTSFGSLPAPVKILGSLSKGLIFDSFMQLFKNRPTLRVLTAAIVGGIIDTAVFTVIRLVFGFPWSKAVQILVGVKTATGVAVSIAAALLAIGIWKSVKDTYLARSISG